MKKSHIILGKTAAVTAPSPNWSGATPPGRNRRQGTGVEVVQRSQSDLCRIGAETVGERGGTTNQRANTLTRSSISTQMNFIAPSNAASQAMT